MHLHDGTGLRAQYEGQPCFLKEFAVLDSTAFKAEVRRLVRLRHPHLVAVTAVLDCDGRAYLELPPRPEAARQSIHSMLLGSWLVAIQQAQGWVVEVRTLMAVLPKSKLLQTIYKLPVWKKFHLYTLVRMFKWSSVTHVWSNGLPEAKRNFPEAHR